MRERWRTEVLGLVAEVHRAVPLGDAALDLGNGRVFLNLIDRPDLNHAYTVVGRIISGIENADRILAGTQIVRVSFSAR